MAVSSQDEELQRVYGLADDPFALSTPPSPGDRLWCFIDRGLDERSTARTLKAVLTQFSTRVAFNRAGNRGLLVIGHWGDGKSHALNAIELTAHEHGTRVARVSARDDADELTKLVGEEKSLFGATFSLAARRLGIKPAGTRAEHVLKDLGDLPTLVLLDQAEDLISYQEDEFLRFCRTLSGVLETAGAKPSPLGVAMAFTPERYQLIKEKASYVLDRFDKARFSDDMSINEAAALIENNLGLVRIKDAETPSPIWPFRTDSVGAILDIWRTEKRTIREFRSKCSKVLKAAAQAQIKEIDRLFAANAIHAQYGNWEHSLAEWRNLERNRHRVLLMAVYNALLKIKGLPDVRYDEVIPEQPYSITTDQRIRSDILVVPHGCLPVAIEIETGQQIGRNKYELVSKLVESREFSGVIVTGLSYKGIIRANKVAMASLKDATRFDVIKLEDTPLKLGRLLSFAALTPDLDFPSSEEVRTNILRSVREDDALSLLKDILGIVDAIDAIKRRITAE